jgi:hypothetical protein
MYCQSCGNQINDELSFCNRCGSRVGGNELMPRDAADASVPVLKLLTASTGVVGVIGIGGLIAMIIKLIENGVETPGPVFLILFFSMTVFGICFLLTRQIARFSSNSGADFSEKRKFKQKGEPEQLNPVDAATQFQPLERPFRSVTENTTRTLDKNKV